jgi:hypothetical protein
VVNINPNEIKNSFGLIFTRWCGKY